MFGYLLYSLIQLVHYNSILQHIQVPRPEPMSKINLHDILFFKNKQNQLNDSLQKSDQFDQQGNIKAFTIFTIGDCIGIDKMLGVNAASFEHDDRARRETREGGKQGAKKDKDELRRIDTKIEVYGRMVDLQVIYASNNSADPQKLSKNILTYQTKIAKIKSIILIISLHTYDIDQIKQKILQHYQMWITVNANAYLNSVNANSPTANTLSNSSNLSNDDAKKLLDKKFKFIVALFNDTKNYKSSKTHLLNQIVDFCIQKKFLLIQFAPDSKVTNSPDSKSKIHGPPSSSQLQASSLSQPSTILQLFHKAYILKCSIHSVQSQYKTEVQTIQRQINELSQRKIKLEYSAIYLMFMNWKSKLQEIVTLVNQLVQGIKACLVFIHRMGDKSMLMTEMEEVAGKVKEILIVRDYVCFRLMGKKIKSSLRVLADKCQVVSQPLQLQKADKSHQRKLSEQQIFDISNQEKFNSDLPNPKLKRLQQTLQVLLKKHQHLYNQIYKNQAQQQYLENFKLLQEKKKSLTHLIHSIEQIYRNFKKRGIQNYQRQILKQREPVAEAEVEESWGQDINNDVWLNQFDEEISRDIGKKLPFQLKSVQEFRDKIETNFKLLDLLEKNTAQKLDKQKKEQEQKLSEIEKQKQQLQQKQNLKQNLKQKQNQNQMQKQKQKDPYSQALNILISFYLKSKKQQFSKAKGNKKSFVYNPNNLRTSSIRDQSPNLTNNHSRKQSSQVEYQPNQNPSSSSTSSPQLPKKPPSSILFDSTVQNGLDYDPVQLMLQSSKSQQEQIDPKEYILRQIQENITKIGGTVASYESDTVEDRKYSVDYLETQLKVMENYRRILEASWGIGKAKESGIGVTSGVPNKINEEKEKIQTPKLKLFG